MHAKTLVELGDAPLINNSVCLKNLSEGELDLVYDLFRDEATAQKVLLRQALQNEADAAQALQGLLARQTYVICLRGDADPIGIIGLQSAHPKNPESVSFFVAIKPAHRRQGYCTSAMKLLFARVFGSSDKEEIGAWVSLEFFKELQPVYEYWGFRPTLTYTLMQLLDDSGGPAMGYLVLNKEEFEQSFPRGRSQLAEISGE